MLMTRSAMVFHGLNPAPDVAAVVDRKIVMWADVMRRRRERNASNLERKRWVETDQAFKLWVAYFDQFPFGGRHAFLENRDERIWIDRDLAWSKQPLMGQFPLVLTDDWDLWKIEFARQFQRRKMFRQPVGVAYIWKRADGRIERAR